MQDLKLSVATNFSPDFIGAMAGYPVKEIFGKLHADRVGGGRASFMLAPLTRAAFKAHVAEARGKDIGFNYLLNPACMDNREYTRQGQKDLMRLLDFIEDCGVDAVTVSLPFLLPIIKRRFPRLKVRVGVYARVDGVAKARYWEDMGADCITLESISVNRDFALLDNIRKSVGLELQLIVNSNCIMHCPLSGQHMVNLSHASQEGHKSRGFMIDYCALRCSCDKLKDPATYLRSEFIRPEDLGIYMDMGYNSFKVLERGAPTSVMAARVRAYSVGGFDGNLLDLIQPYGYKDKAGAKSGPGGLYSFWRYFFRPGTVRLGRLMKLKTLAEKRGLMAATEGEPVYIANKALEGFIDGFRERACRETDCRSCGYCASWAERAVRMDDAWRSEMLRLYEEAFGEMYSGAMWGV